ncbi:KinB-signaling pathway activation protein [Ferviditalea candida]|uniref:KinB-signaling pathway activation protein n=1 Tax=Ferviditalea candida TaxID=3108399 RepID=A0ABU5ZLS5_9BACL|nr:KinB-signaling pathway activation protein [Paenibacillaceae bacterium T2]
MTVRKWLYLFLTTLLIGGIAALATGLIMQGMDQEYSLLGITGFDIFNTVVVGLTLSAFSQMGFFSYMMVNYIAIDIIRKKYWWNMIQLALVIIALFETAYLRYLSFGTGRSYLEFTDVPLLLLAAGLVTAYWKVSMTNRTAFIPTLFFMTAATAIEAVPALRLDNPASTFFMLIPLIVCNAWQILILHKLLRAKKS